MSFEPPTAGKLLALAGWAVSCLPEASPQRQSALIKFRDGCAELAECHPPELLVVRRVPAASLPRAAGPAVQAPAIVARRGASLPIAVTTATTCGESGEHRFSIRTQRCVWCQASYLEIRGRRPELF